MASLLGAYRSKQCFARGWFQRGSERVYLLARLRGKQDLGESIRATIAFEWNGRQAHRHQQVGILGTGDG